MRCDQIREHSAGIRVVFACVAENIVLFAVAMQVKHCLHSAPFCYSLYPPADFSDLGVEHFGGLLPPAVEIYAGDIAPEIAVDDAIHVDHGVYLDYAVFEQIFDLLCLLEQSAHDAQSHVGGPNFAGMLSGREDDHSLLLFLSLLASDRHLGHLVVANRGAYRGAAESEVAERFCLGLYCLQI